MNQEQPESVASDIAARIRPAMLLLLLICAVFAYAYHIQKINNNIINSVQKPLAQFRQTVDQISDIYGPLKIHWDSINHNINLSIALDGKENAEEDYVAIMQKIINIDDNSWRDCNLLSSPGDFKFFELRDAALKCNRFIDKLNMLRGSFPSITPEEGEAITGFHRSTDIMQQYIANLFTHMKSLTDISYQLGKSFNISNASVGILEPTLKQVKLNSILPVKVDGTELLFILNFIMLILLLFIYSQVKEIGMLMPVIDQKIKSYILFQSNPYSFLIASAWILVPTVITALGLYFHVFSENLDSPTLKVVFPILAIVPCYFGVNIIFLSQRIIKGIE